MCIGLRWLRRNDNDSIGDDDRRGVVASNPIVRPRLLRQPNAAPDRQFDALPAAMKCSRADVVTHLKSANRADEAKRAPHEPDNGQAPVKENPLA